MVVQVSIIDLDNIKQHKYFNYISGGKRAIFNRFEKTTT